MTIMRYTHGVGLAAAGLSALVTCSALVSSPHFRGTLTANVNSASQCRSTAVTRNDGRSHVNTPAYVRQAGSGHYQSDSLGSVHDQPVTSGSIQVGKGSGLGVGADWLETGKKWMASAAIMGALIGGMALSSAPMSAVATDAEGSKEIAQCLLTSCQKELAQCVLNPKCFANIICLNTCNGRPDEGNCQIRCGDLFENESVGKFNACAVSAKRCVKQRQDDGSYPVPPDASLVKRFDPALMDGQWYIAAGLNPAFDTFDCQVHFFTNPAPGKLFAKLNWRIKEPDGEFFTKDVIQKFVQDKKNPAVLVNKDNEYLNYKDTWYVLDFERNSHVLIYYRGSNDAWDGYGGAVLYTKGRTVPQSIVPRVREACARANLNWDSFMYNDNSCKPLDGKRATELREQYASKILLSGEEALQRQLTAARSFAGNEVQEVEKGALSKLEGLREKYEKEIEEVKEEVTEIGVGLEETVEQEVKELVTGARFEVNAIETEAQEISRSINNEVWKVREEPTLNRLLKKMEAAEK